MAIPIINLTTSILGYNQWQTWAFQPFAQNAPTSWAASTLPPGVTINATTGLISGAVTVAGVYVVGLTASNSDGTSVAVVLTIGIAAGSASNDSGADVSVDVGTGAVTLPPGLVVKEDDDLMFFFSFMKGSVALDLGTLSALNLAIKEFEPDSTLVVSSGFQKLGSGSNTIYQLYIHLDSTALAAALSSYEADAGTTFNAVCELEWVMPNSSGIGPSTCRRSSQLFTLPIFRNVNPI